MAVAGLRIITLRKSGKAWPLIVVLGLAASAAVPVLASGTACPHYWMQLLPFFGIFASLALDAIVRLVRQHGMGAGLAGSLIAGILVALPLGSAIAVRMPAAIAVATTSDNRAGSRYDIEATARHIAANGVIHPRIWALRMHLIHWYLGDPQLSRAGVHPDNLARLAIIDTLHRHSYVSSDETGRLMSLLPDFVITDAKGIGIGWLRGSGKPADAWLAAHCRLDARFGDVLIYRRSG